MKTPWVLARGIHPFCRAGRITFLHSASFESVQVIG